MIEKKEKAGRIEISETSEINKKERKEESKSGAERKEDKVEEKAEDKHLLVKKYLQQHSLVESNILSFNDFINIKLQEIVNSINDDISRDEIELWLGKISVGKPRIIEADGSRRDVFPIEARLRKATYSAPVYLEIRVGNNEFSTVEIGKIPIMVKSKYCDLSGLSHEDLIKNYEDPYDSGGYFIINGNERVLVMIEDLAQNQPFIEETKKGLALRLFSSRGSYRIPIAITQRQDGLVLVSFSRFKEIPAILLVKALGINKDSDINSFIGIESAPQ